MKTALFFQVGAPRVLVFPDFLTITSNKRKDFANHRRKTRMTFSCRKHTKIVSKVLKAQSYDNRAGSHTKNKIEK